MQAAWKRTAAGILLWSALAWLGAARQADGSGEWSAWKGAPAPWKSPAEAERTVADYRAWLAELRVKLMTGRAAELPGWEERLETIRLHATSAVPVPAQRELLVEVARARAQALASLGRFDEARAAAEAVLFAPGEPAAAKHPLVSAPPALIKLAQAALADPALEEVRSDLAPTAQAGPAQEDGLDERLRQAVREEDFQLLKQVGARAAPVIEEALAADLEALPLEFDLLSILVEVNERRAAAFALAHLDAGPTFRLRVVRAMENHGVFSQKSGVWGPPRGTGDVRTVLISEWQLVLAGLLGHADSAAGALPSVAATISANGLAPEVSDALIAALRTSAPDLQAELYRLLLQVQQPKESARGLYAFLVAHGDPATRRMAAWQLHGLLDVATLLTRAQDTDPEVRRVVAFALRGNAQQRPPPADDAAVAALRHLLADPSPEVRRIAVQALIALPRPLEPELYRAAARDADAGIRSEVALIQHSDEALMSEVLSSLARDADPGVRKEVDARLTVDDPSLPDSAERMARALLPAAELRLADDAVPPARRGLVITRMGRTDEGLKSLFASAAAHPEGPLLAAVVGRAEAFSTSTGTRMRALLVLDDALLARSYVLMYGVSRDLFDELDGVLADGTPPRRAAMEAVLEDPAAPVYVRLRAAVHAAAAGGARFREAWLALLSGEPLRSSEPAVWELTAIQLALDALPAEDRNPLARAALQGDALHDRVRARLASAYVPTGPLARELTLGILARWGGATDDRAGGAVSTALLHLRALPEDVDPALLERALQNPAYAEAALATITALQDARYLPALEGALRSNDPSTRSRAVEALTAFPGDQATEVLLRAAAGGNQQVRQHALQALGERRTVEEQRRLWQDSKEARLERADAVQRLLAQLRDADAAVRSQAARALGTLGALETLPVLIDLLKDKDPGVRQAASAALDRLNAAQAAGGEGG